MNQPPTRRALMCLVICVTLTACSKAPAPKDAAPNPKTFSITATNQIVTAERMGVEPETRVVRADFNMDNLEDMAVEEKDAKGNSLVGIYLRRAETLREEYYRAGGIHQSGDYRITALMSSRDRQHTDLVVMFTFADGSKDMVQFRSTGTQFEELSRTHTAAPGARP